MGKKYFILIIFLIFMFDLLSSVYAGCQTSLDDYAIEVLLNKPGIYQIKNLIC
jgi:hypothetical protein